MEIRSDQSHHVDRPVREVWDAIQRVDDYRRWWPWLRRLEAEGVRAGDVWSCTVQPPLPYTLRFDIAIDEVAVDDHAGPDRAEVDIECRVAATVDGDIRGSASLVLSPSGDGCEIELSSVLRPESRALQLVSTLAPRMARFGHDRVLEAGIAQFRRRAW